MNALALLLAVAPAQAPVEVPFRRGEDAIIVDAMVNGKKISCMFDTGFSGSVVLDNTLNVGPISGTSRLRDFVGEFEAQTVKIRSFSLGGEVYDAKKLSDIILTPPNDYSFAYGTHVNGIMGFDILKDHVVEINFEKNKFVFYPKSVDISKRVPDNKKTFLAKLLPIGGNSLEMSVEAATGKKMTLALDTGNAFFATTHKDVLERVGLWSPDTKVKYMGSSGVASGAVDSFDFKMPPVKIFGVPVPESYWSIIDLPSSSAEGDGTIGFGFLKNFNIVIDYDRRRVWMENFTGQVGNEQMGETGLAAGYYPPRKRTVVFSVSPETPAAEAGIKEGDEILSVDGKDLNQAGFRQMRRLLEGPIGSKVEVVVSGRGQLRRLTLERKALVNVSTIKE